MKTYIVAVDYTEPYDNCIYSAQRKVRADNERSAEMIAADLVQSEHDWLVSVVRADCLMEDPIF